MKRTFKNTNYVTRAFGDATKYKSLELIVDHLNMVDNMPNNERKKIAKFISLFNIFCINHKGSINRRSITSSVKGIVYNSLREHYLKRIDDLTTGDQCSPKLKSSLQSYVTSKLREIL